MRLECALPLFVGLAAAVSAAAAPPKLIISVLVDDLGAGDLGYTGSGIATPHLDRLRREGVLLEAMYVQPICTPTRSSFLTGRLPLSFGLQGKQTVQQGQAWGLDVLEQCFPQSFRAGGWSTHMVGKVHIGGDRWSRTPTWRGFDTFLGYLYGAEDYYSHILGAGWDLRNDSRIECGPGCSENIGEKLNGTYSTYIFGAEMERLIARAGSLPSPTYIHFTPQNVHAPNEAPPAFVAPYIPVFGPDNPVRAIHAGALAVLDEAIGNITAAIAAAGLSEETLIFLSADNGGPLGPTGDGTMASNYPLRGGKHSLYSGGVLATSFMWGPTWLGVGVNRSWSGLAHISDVGATLLEAGGVTPLPPKPGKDVSGTSFWGAITSGAPSSRQDVIINVDYTSPPQGAIVGVEGWKLILGAPGTDDCTYWSDRDGKPITPPPEWGSNPPLDVDWSYGATTTGGVTVWPLGNMTASLYHLPTDPRETTNVAASNRGVVQTLLGRIAVWGQQAVPVVENTTTDPRSNPRHFNGSWTPWLGI